MFVGVDRNRHALAIEEEFENATVVSELVRVGCRVLDALGLEIKHVDFSPRRLGHPFQQRLVVNQGERVGFQYCSADQSRGFSFCATVDDRVFPGSRVLLLERECLLAPMDATVQPDGARGLARESGFADGVTRAFQRGEGLGRSARILIFAGSGDVKLCRFRGHQERNDGKKD